MNKVEKPQILVLSLLAILLIIAPLLSSSLRTPYLYIITNLLIIALGAQAGLLSAFSNPSDHDKDKPLVMPSELAYSDKRVVADSDEDKRVGSESSKKSSEKSSEKKAKVVEKSRSEKIAGTVKIDSVKKCPSMPSLFFIGGSEADQEDHEVIEEKHEMEEEEVVVGELSGQELFTKAETFIGNFYKQLKMQREDSWKKIHDFYHKAF
ncbi:PREDICTED: uncharacterized protein LOC103326523 [Prunus mume]|uniref:Uncharacterized protein LOC103326523 n=1 Tax=Prunus mume TaxID=102107 RepID=A0ABM0NMF3_PRUMU|nr:PREDICTED: uncharacterized protein LOC103326523 [Prunus mume]